MLKTNHLLLVPILFLLATCAAAQKVETGFLDRAVVINGEEFHYQVYVPREFRHSIKWPIILALHGGGSYGSDGIRQTAGDGGVAGIIRRYPERIPAIVVFPQAHEDRTPGWQRNGGLAALAAVENAVKEFKSHYAEKWAAVVVICGFIFEFRGKTSNVLYPALEPPSEKDPYAALAKKVERLPIWIFHGDADQSVSVEESRKMAAALKTIGANVQYTEFPGVGHDAWIPAYERADLFE
jgi:predicted peptidase